MSVNKISAFKIFNIPNSILDSILLDPRFEKQGVSAQNIHLQNKKRLEAIKAQNVMLIPDSNSCTLCGEVVFDSFLEQREHYKSPIHLKNLELKMAAQDSSPLSSEISIGNDANSTLLHPKKLVASDIGYSETAGIDPSLFEDYLKTDDFIASRVWFSTNAVSDSVQILDPAVPRPPTKLTQYGIFKAVLFDKKSKSLQQPSILSELKSLQLSNLEKNGKNTSAEKIYWSILLLSGGHFAAGVFDNQTGKLVAHKTIHRYTTRKKQGKSQSSHDNAKNQHAKSAGAQLRRYNEQKLLDEIKDTLNSWKQYLMMSSRIFQSTSKASRRVFFGHESSVVPYDSPTIRICPLQVKRPTLDEVSRVYGLLSCVFTRSVDYIQPTVTAPKSINSNIAVPDQSEAQDYSSSSDLESDGTLDPEPRPELVAFLYEAASMIQDKDKTNEQVIDFLKTNKSTLLDAFLDPATELRYLEKCPLVNGSRSPTLLFLAAMYERPESILFLLDHGDDPSITNGHPPMYSGGKTAYEMSPSRPIRDVFRKYRFDNEVVFEPADDFSEWNSSRIPKGWKEPDPVKLQPHPQKDTKVKQKKAPKPKPISQPPSNTGSKSDHKQIETSNNKKSEIKQSGILNSLKSKPSEPRRNMSRLTPNSQFSVSSGKTLATGSGLQNNRLTTNALQGDLAAQRELRAKAAEARLAKLGGK
ncbi:Protein vms-1 [Smittium mucronatum]|uniref:Protein vms-1 n=1 Tax=Smittium mucronatum TaxID=133383 RepID=A0A1R0GZZ9_9FUNG|nr:Protein vms-1 [Smittium mucronatum]